MEDTYQCPKCGRFFGEEIICPYCKDTIARSSKSQSIIDQQAERIQELEGYKEGARDCLQSAKKRIKELEAEIVDLKSQKPPCSANCYHHQTHPCENCGRINGYLPSVWQAMKGVD